MPAGRPSKYQPAFVDQAEKLCKLGATDVEVADFFNVSVATLNRWKYLHPDFCASLKTGKSEADERVERSLYHKATGYTFDAVKIFMPAGADEPVYAPYSEHVPPDTTACIFWLKNRRPDLWRDARDVNVKRVDDLSEEELAERIRQLDDRIASALGRASESGGTPGKETRH